MSEQENKPKNPFVYPFFEYNRNGYGNAVVLNDGQGNMNVIPFTEGITLLDHFAGIAITGLAPTCTQGYEEELSKRAYSLASAMLKERQKHL